MQHILHKSAARIENIYDYLLFLNTEVHNYQSNISNAKTCFSLLNHKILDKYGHRSRLKVGSGKEFVGTITSYKNQWTLLYKGCNKFTNDDLYYWKGKINEACFYIKVYMSD